MYCIYTFVASFLPFDMLVSNWNCGVIINFGMTQFADAYNNNTPTLGICCTATDLFNFSILNYNNLKNKHTVGMNES